MSGNKLVQLLNQYKSEHTILETNKSLQIKPITTGQMKSILQYEGSEDLSIIEQILDEIIEGCVETEGFSVDDLTLQDRFDLLIAIRKASKGSIYNFNIKCPKCGIESIQGVDLNDLEVTPYPTEKDGEIKVNDMLTVTLDFVRRGQQKSSEALVKSMPGLTDNQIRSEIATYMYAYGMVKFSTKQGDLADISVDDKKEFLDELSADAYDKINDWYETNDYGTKFKYTVECKAGNGCDFKQEEDIPITGFFF